MRVPILSGLCAALLLLFAAPAIAGQDGPPNCQPPAPRPVVHIRHVSHPSCGPAVHRVAHHRRIVRHVEKRVVVIQREQVQATCDPCARPPEHPWIPLRGPAGGPDWDYIAQYEQSMHREDGDHHWQGPAQENEEHWRQMHREWEQRSDGTHQEWEEHFRSMHYEQQSWSSDCRCWRTHRPSATDRLGYLTWPDKTRTWRDQSPDAPPPNP